MNLGIFINDFSDENIIQGIGNLTSLSLTNKNIDDVSIFFNGLQFNKYNIRCGMFNATELWSFHGALLVTSLNCLLTANNVINNIDIFYYYNLEKENNILDLIRCTKNVKVICKSEQDQKELYRLTGKKSIGISENFNNILDLIMEHTDERRQNRNNVYQTA